MSGDWVSMQPNDGSRFGLSAEEAKAVDDGVLPVLGVPYIMLTAMIAPLPLLWALTVPFAIVLYMIGHPGVAVWAIGAGVVADTIAQTLYRRWKPTADSEPEQAIRRLGVAVFLRAIVAVSGAVAVVLTNPGHAELTFLGVVSALLLCVAVAQGTLSAPLFWLSAMPVLAGMALCIVVSFPMREAVGLLGGVAVLACFLAMMAGSTGRILGDWTEMREKNNTLIERLRAECEEADEAREIARLAGQAKANFLATMSHEIRTPMNGVLGMAQLLKRSAHDEEQRRQVETLIHSGEFLMSILNDILDISKIDAGRLEIAEDTEDVHRLFDSLARLWRPTADEKHLTLDFRIAPDVPAWVGMDARRARQILFNLIGNALKFTAEGGVTVSVTAEPLSADAVSLHIAVADTGIGIDPAVLPTLFERFSQADQSTSRQFGGAGLGLAISRQLSELMDGDLWVESRPGEGATFHLVLPVAIAAAPEAEAPEIFPDSDQTAAPLSILIVDDNPVNLTVLDQILAAFGHQVTKAGDGPEALAAAARRPFDLILLDIQMPGMSGVEALKALRKTEGPNRDTRALAVTADVLSRDRNGYLGMGFCGHIAKPIRVNDLAEEMIAVMSGPRPVSAAA